MKYLCIQGIQIEQGKKQIVEAEWKIVNQNVQHAISFIPDIYYSLV